MVVVNPSLYNIILGAVYEPNHWIFVVSDDANNSFFVSY